MIPVAATTICSRGFNCLSRFPCGKGLIFALPPDLQILLSPANPQTGIVTIILQSYYILLSMLFSINHQQLSLFDANHALLLICSPSTIQMVHICIRELFGSGHHHLKRIKYHPRVVYTFGALLLPIWLGLSLTLRVSGRAFIDSKLCNNPTFKGLLIDFLASTEMISHEFYSLLPPNMLFNDSGYFALFFLFSMIAPYPGRLIRKFTQRATTFPRAQEGTPEPLGRLRVLWTLVKHGLYVSVISGADQSNLIPCRRIINRKFGRLAVIMLELHWAYAAILNSYWASGEEYVVSYGQV
jgi:hypothetical protein